MPTTNEIIFTCILPLIAGLAFFLYGMTVMSKSLEKMAGGKLEYMLKKATANPFISLVLGAGITIAIQSSSATTVMLVGLVNSGIIEFGKTLYVILGANIGTTLTAWITSLSGISLDGNLFVSMLKPANFSPIIALVGIVMLMMCKSNKKKSIATILVGFAILMTGMNMMSNASEVLENIPAIKNAFGTFGENPLLGLLVGTVVTAIIQSSAASVAMLQALAISGLGITNAVAIPIIMGQNIGTCITAMISCIGTNKNAKRVAVLHLTVNIIGSTVCMAIFLVLRYLFGSVFSAFFDAPTDGFKIAILHTVFNILATAAMLPLKKPVEKLIMLMVRDKNEVKRSETFIDERIFNSPSIAIEECGSLTVKMSSIAHETINMSIDNLYIADPKCSQIILENEDRLDKFEDKLGTYLVKLSSRSLSDEDSRRTSKLLHTIGDFERIGDHAVNILKVSEEMKTKKITFSDNAKEELEVVASALKEILSITEKAFAENSLELAAKVEPLEQVIDGLITKVKANHIDRLQKGDCTIELGFILNDLLTNYSRISDHCSNIAVAIIETEHNSFATHKYLSGVKSFEDERLHEMYDEYSSQYSIK